MHFGTEQLLNLFLFLNLKIRKFIYPKYCNIMLRGLSLDIMNILYFKDFTFIRRKLCSN